MSRFRLGKDQPTFSSAVKALSRSRRFIINCPRMFRPRVSHPSWPYVHAYTFVRTHHSVADSHKSRRYLARSMGECELCTGRRKRIDGGYHHAAKVTRVLSISKSSTTLLQRGQAPHPVLHRLARCKRSCIYSSSSVCWLWPHTPLRPPLFPKDRRLNRRQTRCQPNEVNSDTGRASIPQSLPMWNRIQM